MKGEVYIEIRDKNGNLKQKIKEENKVFDNITPKVKETLKLLGIYSSTLFIYLPTYNDYATIGLYNYVQDETTALQKEIPEYVGTASTSIASNKNGQLVDSIMNGVSIKKTWLFNITENTTIKSIALLQTLLDNGGSTLQKLKLKDGRFFNFLKGSIDNSEFLGTGTEIKFYKQFITHKKLIANAADGANYWHILKDRTRAFTVNNNSLLVIDLNTYNIIQTIPLPTPTTGSFTKQGYAIIYKQGNFLYAYNKDYDTTNRKMLFYKFDPTSPNITITETILTIDNAIPSNIDYEFHTYTPAYYSDYNSDSYAYMCEENAYIGNYDSKITFDFDKLSIRRYYKPSRCGNYFCGLYNLSTFNDDENILYGNLSPLSTLLNLKTPIDLIAGDVLNLEYTITIV